LALTILQRREGDVQNEGAVRSRRGVEFVDIPDFFETPTLFAENLLERVGKVFGE
jgi:hypothetical protein